MFIELHLIQSFAPSNLNRDDTGNPKDTDFGGVRRARISSQCIKRSIRLAPIFREVTGVEPAVRTRWMSRRLKEKFVAAGKPEEDADLVALVLARAFSGKMDGDRTSVLVYLSDAEYQAMADALLAEWDAALQVARNKERGQAAEQKPYTDIVRDFLRVTRGRTSAPDIALFGRMLADKPDLNLDAACQVAHAISTHRVNMDLDFFTAVDDLQQESETGAAMMGVTGFNSACFYRYARLDWEQLVRNLDGDVALARRTLEGFLRAALQAVPAGKQNAFAAQNPPSLALAVTRQDGMSWSLANAFEKPVRPDRDGGLVTPSIQALDAYWEKLQRVYGGDDVRPHVLLVEDVELRALAGSVAPDVDAWVKAVLDALPEA